MGARRLPFAGALVAPLLASDSAIRTPPMYRIAVFPLGPGLNAGSACRSSFRRDACSGAAPTPRGFLVERDLDDGSRWIGRNLVGVAPSRWLIADEHFNFRDLLPRRTPGTVPRLCAARRGQVAE